MEEIELESEEIKELKKKKKRKMAIALITAGMLIVGYGFIMGIKTMKPLDFNLAVGVVIVIATAFGYFGKRAQDLSSSEKSNALLSKVNEQAEVIGKLEKKNEELNNLITGGNSYCFGDIIPDESNSAMLAISQVGKYPLSDILLNFRPVSKDMELAKHPEHQTYQNMLSLALSGKTFRIGNLPADSQNTRVINRIPFDHNKAETYFLDFIGKNGHWKQLIDFQFGADRKLKYAYKVVWVDVENGNEKERELKKYVEPGYPKNGVVNNDL